MLDELLALTRDRLPDQAQISSDYDLDSQEENYADRPLREAAVLLAVLPGADGAAQLILTRRSSALKNHAGQIAFPGGKRDEQDANLAQTALREAREEIGLPAQSVEILGALAPHQTVTNFIVTPYIAQMSEPFTSAPDPNEVDEVFTVPLDFVLSPENFQIQSRRWRGGVRSYYTVPFGPYYIWGATARMLKTWSNLIYS